MKWFAGSTPSFHPGRIRMRDTLQARYHNCRLRSAIDQLHCQDCQRHKLAGKDYGLLPECEVRVAPWEEVAIDLIGPWKNKFGIKLVEFNALTCIDTASNLVELVRIDNKTSNHSSRRHGSVFTLARFVVSMIREVNSLVASSNGSWTLLVSKILVHLELSHLLGICFSMCH
jgi:hypothetical protein